MKRYYICPITGDGRRATTAFRSILQDYINVHWSQYYKPIKTTPIWYGCPWSIEKRDLPDNIHNDLMVNLPQLYFFPQGLLSRSLADIPVQQRQAMRNKLENIGFDFDWCTLSTTIKEILEYLFHSINLAKWGKVIIGSKNFDINKTISQIPIEARQDFEHRLNYSDIGTAWITPATTLKEIAIQFRNLNIFYRDDDVE